MDGVVRPHDGCNAPAPLAGLHARSICTNKIFRMTRRPLSPHLQIYRPMLTMVMSIVHRITGAALYFGTILLVAWLACAAAGPESFATARNIAASLPGKAILLLYTWALVHHALGGLRHLVWDTGRGFELPTVERMAQLNLAGSLVLTALIWFLAWL